MKQKGILMNNLITLSKQFAMFEKLCGGTLGIAAQHIESGQSISYKDSQFFLMCSTYKLPMAIYLLSLYEQQKVDLDELYTLKDTDLRSGFAFTLNDFDCRNGFPISYRNLLIMMLRESCNTSTDIILKKIGGPAAVTAFINEHDIFDMSIDRSTLEILAASDGVKNLPENLECTIEEYKALVSKVPKEELEKVKAAFSKDDKDCATPHAMTDVLVKLFQNEWINEDNTRWLLSTMRRNKLYPNRLMGLLPAKTPVAHKTGTASGFTNDAGIITLPHDLGHVAITAFIKDAPQDKTINERVIAEACRTVYDYFIFAC